MSDDRDLPDRPDDEEMRANPHYALGQLSKSFVTSMEHEDAAVRERARGKVADWMQVFEGMLSGALQIGSRAPMPSTPVWATPKVVKGGFATGKLLAGGAIQPHERARLSTLPSHHPGAERAALNSYYVTDAGLAELRAMLESGCYRVNVPEEGALAVVAWLLEHGHSNEARVILDAVGPFMGSLRFYPVSNDEPIEVTDGVYLQDIGQTVEDLKKVSPSEQIEKMRESIQVWAPLCDRAVALFAETIKDGWPCQEYPPDWKKRAQSVLDEYKRQRAEHKACGKPERKGENLAILRETMAKCVKDAKLTGKEVGMVRKVLKDIEAKRGLPGSKKCQSVRDAQSEQIRHPLSAELAAVLVSRLQALPQDGPLKPDYSAVEPISEAEAKAFSLRPGAPISDTLRAKILRSTVAPVRKLVAQGTIGSADQLAIVIPQMSSQARVASIDDPSLRRLYAEIYKAFRRRRSLLLLNLESQVKFTELPWISVLSDISSGPKTDEQARRVLDEVVLLYLREFPERIVPNKLLPELRTLADAAGMRLPFLDELAADIFMGQFSEKFLVAAKTAARLLEGTLYERYYDVPYARVRELDDVRPTRHGAPSSEGFGRLCHELAGASDDGSRSVARNGTIIEQSQIITTHNLAVLFDALKLGETLGDELYELPRRCFRWICYELRQKSDSWRGLMHKIKNCAYAWRQMVFFLSVMPAEQVDKFIFWANEHLDKEPERVRSRFRPALDALAGIVLGKAASESIRRGRSSPGRFLGWTTERHWLLPPKEEGTGETRPGADSNKPWWQIW